MPASLMLEQVAGSQGPQRPIMGPGGSALSFHRTCPPPLHWNLTPCGTESLKTLSPSYCTEPCTNPVA